MIDLEIYLDCFDVGEDNYWDKETTCTIKREPDNERLIVIEFENGYKCKFRKSELEKAINLLNQSE